MTTRFVGEGVGSSHNALPSLSRRLFCRLHTELVLIRPFLTNLSTLFNGKAHRYSAHDASLASVCACLLPHYYPPIQRNTSPLLSFNLHLPFCIYPILSSQTTLSLFRQRKAMSASSTTFLSNSFPGYSRSVRWMMLKMRMGMETKKKRRLTMRPTRMARDHPETSRTHGSHSQSSLLMSAATGAMLHRHLCLSGRRSWSLRVHFHRTGSNQHNWNGAKSSL